MASPCRGSALGGVVLCAWLALFSCRPHSAIAQAGTAVDRVGWNSSGMRGLERIALLSARAPEVVVAADAGYGLTESLGPAHGAHHRAAGSLAVAASVRQWLGFGVRFDGRHDVHPDDGMGGDSSTVGDPRLLLRAGGALDEQVQLGGSVGLWVPGENAPSLAFDATTLDLRASAAWLPTRSPWTLAASAGYRLDNSARAAPDLRTLRPGDRLALELSSFDALLLALGVVHALGKLELFGELSWDVLVGSGAPSAGQSPLRVQLGARVQLLSALQLAFAASVAASGRPEQTTSDRLVPVEPRFALQAGLRYAVGSGPAITHEHAAAESASQSRPPAAEPTAAAPTRGPLGGRLLDADGQPVAGARVVLRAPAPERETTTDEQGRYAFEDVPFGPIELRAEREGYDGSSWSTQLGSSGGEQPDRVLPRAAVGQLRGLALAWSGKPVAADVRVRSLDRAEAEPSALHAGNDGRFRLDLPPGRYEVVVAAPGFVEQTRTIEIAADGVVILNLDLRTAK